MRYRAEHFQNEAQLNAGDPRLLELDGLLAKVARDDVPPAALVEQVMQASRPLLAGQRATIGRIGDSLSPRAGRQRAPSLQPSSHRRIWSRVALAAALLLSFTLAARVFMPAGPASLSPNALLAMSIVSGGDNQVARFLGSGGNGSGTGMPVEGMGSLSGALFRDPSFEAFGIFGARADDLLGDLPPDIDLLGG